MTPELLFLPENWHESHLKTDMEGHLQINKENLVSPWKWDKISNNTINFMTSKNTTASIKNNK